MSPFGDMFSARLDLSAQADRRPKAPSPDFESAGPRRPAACMEFANSIMKSPGYKTAPDNSG